MVGVQGTGLRAFIGISQEKWTDGWIDVEGGEPEIMEDLKWGFYRMFRKILQTYCIPCDPKFKCMLKKYQHEIKLHFAVPLQAWSGPEVSRKLRFPDFMTTAQNGGKVVSLTHRPPLPPGNTSGIHFC